MSTIIKRRKTANYTQINNLPIQQDLSDLAAIGLLSYIMSLPDDWTLHKSYLHKRFSRRRVDNAWKLLVENYYIIGFYAHIDGKKQYYYNVSDLPFTQHDFDEFVSSVISQLEGNNKNVLNVEPINDSVFNSSIVRNVQHKMNSTECTTTKEVKRKEIETNKHSLSIVNKGTIIDTCNQFYTEFAINRWSKQEWNTLINKYADELINSGRHLSIKGEKLTGYIYQSIKNIAYKHDLKHGKDIGETQGMIREMFT